MRALLLAMLGVGIAFALIIWLGFWIHQNTSAVPDTVFGVAAALAIVGIAWAFIFLAPRLHSPQARARLFRAKPKRLIKADIERVRKEAAEIRQRRIAELQADPLRSKYAALIERGEQWSDEQIEYHENPRLVVTCAHLETIESAIRGAGIPVRRWHPPGKGVSADCCVREEELARRFAWAPCVHYGVRYNPDRSEFDNPVGEIRCVVCGSVIQVIHASEARENTRWFPEDVQ
jgi:hypothetical protein